MNPVPVVTLHVQAINDRKRKHLYRFPIAICPKPTRMMNWNGKFLEKSTARGDNSLPFLFAITLFVSATLLFLVQPMIAKMILPLLGGTPAVWNTCMVFFQAALLAGYAYAHAL